MGEDYYPMPLSQLKSDTNLGGYRVGVIEDRLKAAPKYDQHHNWDWNDRTNGRRPFDRPSWFFFGGKAAR